jgi:hypothetical protein
MRKDKQNKTDDELKLVEIKAKKTDICFKRIGSAVSITSLIFTIIISSFSTFTVNKVKSDSDKQLQEFNNYIVELQEQNQSQSQEIENSLDIIQDQYTTIQNLISQEQNVDVIQARDSDILIRTSDDKWLIIPMINSSDITHSANIVEEQYNVGEITLDRFDLFNDNNEDWSQRDSFTYTLPFLSINPSKMLSLSQFIDSIYLEFVFYKNDQTTYIKDTLLLYNNEIENDYLNFFENIMIEKQYVTNEYNDGIEDIKINIIINYEINDEIHSIPYFLDYFIPVV